MNGEGPARKFGGGISGQKSSNPEKRRCLWVPEVAKSQVVAQGMTDLGALGTHVRTFFAIL